MTLGITFEVDEIPLVGDYSPVDLEFVTIDVCEQSFVLRLHQMD